MWNLVLFFLFWCIWNKHNNRIFKKENSDQVLKDYLLKPSFWMALILRELTFPFCLPIKLGAKEKTYSKWFYAGCGTK